MRQNMESIVPALGDTIAQWIQGVLTQQPDQAEGVAGLVENTCISIQEFPYGRYAEVQEIAIRGYDLVLALRANQPEKRAQTLTNLGVAYLTQAQFGLDPAANLDQAIAAYTEAAAIRRRPGLEKDLASTLNNLGNAYQTQAQFGLDPAANLDQAIAAYTEAAAIRRRPGLEKDLASTLNNLGNAYQTQAQFGLDPAANLDQAIAAYTEAAAIMRRPGLEKDLASTLTNLGVAYLTQAEFGLDPAANLDQAIAAYTEAAAIRRRPGLEKDLASTLNNLGNAYQTQAQFGLDPAANLDQAIAAYTEAAAIRRRPGLEKDLASTLTNLGVAYLTQAEFGLDPAANLDQAIAAYTEAAAIRRRPGLEKDLASTLTNLGVAYLTQAEFGLDPAANLDQAIAAYTEAAAIRRRPGLEKDLASTLNNLGNAYQTQAQFGLDPAANLDQAIAAYTEAAAIRRRPGLEKDLASTLTNLGVAYLTQAEFGLDPAANLDQAIAAYTEAAAIMRRPGLEKDLASTLTNLGVAYRTQAEFGLDPAANLDQAIAAYTEAAAIMRRPGLEKDLASTLTNLGVAYLTQAEFGLDPAANLDQAIAAYTEAAAIMRRPGLEKDLASTLNNWGFTYQQQSQYYSSDPERKQTALENAYRTFAEALEQVEYLRGEITTEDYKRNFNEQWNKIYRGMVEVCLELGNYTAAIEYADRSKARNLVELIATRDAYPQGISPEDRQRLQQLRQAIFQEDRRLQQDPNRDSSHLNQLRDEFQKKFPYQPLHFPQIQQLLDEETAILEWYILGDKFLTFTLTAQTLHLWTSSPEDLEKLGEWGNAYLNDYRRNKTQWQDNLQQRLDSLTQILHLDEILQNLRENFPNCQKLILIPHRYLHLFPIHALPVLTGENQSQTLQELFPKGVNYAPSCQLLQQAQNRPRRHFTHFFAVQNPTEDLTFADVEVETIRSLFPQRRSLQRNNATKATFLAKDLSQTHHLFFSCNAEFNPNSPLDSGLQLADGILTLEEIIASLNLSECSLVTLSACESGQVALDQTDEYISLSSGFILAGSPSILVSLWFVDEVSTALLLIKTYETLQQHPGQLAIALKTAQIWLRDTTVAGFQDWVQKCPLLGDWRDALAEFFQNLGQNEKGINDRPYKSPYHWAAFCVVGQGEQNMASDRDKIQAFIKLIQENPDNLFADHWSSLTELPNQFTDDDEKNVELIEQWVKEPTRTDIYQVYQDRYRSANPLLGATGHKGGFGSQQTPKEAGKSSGELIDQAIKHNTTRPDSPRQSPQNES
ncbi:CHAT domain-containing protein [Oxynema aestuarii AP17]|uniref:CHAT domain-containing protein n=2 Tax=Oxynema TaxID=1492710 RepID=A0A6H1U4A0_9CYAN|nr:CHAT domain-containing protein [Oxynema aestuarii AP17]